MFALLLFGFEAEPIGPPTGKAAKAVALLDAEVFEGLPEAM